MQNVPYPYEVNGKLVTGIGSLIPISSLSNRSLLPSLTVFRKSCLLQKFVKNSDGSLIRILEEFQLEIKMSNNSAQILILVGAY